MANTDDNVQMTKISPEEIPPTDPETGNISQRDIFWRFFTTMYIAFVVLIAAQYNCFRSAFQQFWRSMVAFVTTQGNLWWNLVTTLYNAFSVFVASQFGQFYSSSDQEVLIYDFIKKF